MRYRSIADLNDDIVRNLNRIPGRIDLVVGIPRSGLLAGAMLALALNVPLADLEGFIEGRTLASGQTRRRLNFDRAFDELQHILVIDDSIFTGAALTNARKMIQAAYPGKHFTFCAVSVAATHPAADLILEIVPHPRMFQWNFLHHDFLRECCVDIDGVLCVDPTQAQNDDGENYLRFLQNAPPLYTPTKSIGYLVTSRLEKYRPQTVDWLAARGISYRKLIMLDLPTQAERQRSGVHARFKGEVYKGADAQLFIESDRWQAPEIARISGKHVLCIETQELLAPYPLSPAAISQSIRTLPRRLRERRHVNGLKAILREVLGSELYNTLKRIAGVRVR